MQLKAPVSWSYDALRSSLFWKRSSDREADRTANAMATAATAAAAIDP